MVWLWLQSLALIAVAFALGLWLGQAVSQAAKAMRRPPVPQSRFISSEDDGHFPAYHGADIQPAPVPAVAEAVAEATPAPLPDPMPAAPRPRARPPLLFPVNQFGIVTVTQAPAI